MEQVPVKTSMTLLCPYHILLKVKLKPKWKPSSVGRASAWSHTVIAPGFEFHQCLAGMWKRWLHCHAGCQEVSRCHTRGESQGMCNVTHMPPLSSNKAEPTLALKPRGDVTRSPKQGISGPTKRTHVLLKLKKKSCCVMICEKKVSTVMTLKDLFLSIILKQ